MLKWVFQRYSDSLLLPVEIWSADWLMLMLPLQRDAGKETRGRFLRCQWRRGFTMLNKQLSWENCLSVNESTAYPLIFNLFVIKQWFRIELSFRIYTKKMPFYKRSHRLLRQVGFSSWHFSFIPIVYINGDSLSHNLHHFETWNSIPNSF